MVSSKVDLSFNRIARLRDLDELAVMLFPHNRNHQRVFLAVFVELKWADNQILPALEPLAHRYGFTRRTLQTVRAKMRRLGLIDHVSRLSRRHGYREGWVLSQRFSKALHVMAGVYETLVMREGYQREQKDRALITFLQQSESRNASHDPDRVI